eukprot:TRINITY_DN8664_c0_g1_i2.p1 TRINITY_DN8664_c0_g1~~TRINITY_DN8664_c0_g1_i2.p1  ORF type:complete len:762 (-),score=109.98 TRINITY_DN8664_c0_g1_i2:17-2302(-)
MVTKSYVQLLSCGKCDVGTCSFLVFFDNYRYLFNVGESLQRICLEHKIRLSKVNRVFFTNASWKNVGGLPGMLLTVADIGVTTLSLYGPTLLARFIASLRHFSHRSQLDIEIEEFSNEDGASSMSFDSQLDVIPIVICAPFPAVKLPSLDQSDPIFQLAECAQASQKAEFHAEDTILLESKAKRHKADERTCNLRTEKTPNGTKHSFSYTAANMNQLVQLKDSSSDVPTDRRVCYICQTPEIPGKFDPKKAHAMGLKAGPKFGLLTKGQTVTTDEGRVVRPEDCVGPSHPGAVFIVLDLPSDLHFQRLRDNATIKEYVVGKYRDRVAFVIHNTSDEVFSQKTYKDWIGQFHATTQHIHPNRSVCDHETLFLSSAMNQFKLHTLQPAVFPLISKPIAPSNSGLPKSIKTSRALTKLVLSPINAIGVDRTDEKTLVYSKEETVKLLTENQGLFKLWTEHQSRSVVGDQNPPKLWEIVFLGTGAALPSKYRNVSGIFLNLFDQGGVIFDCGEGSIGQLRRKYGEDTDRIVASIKMICITHMHADHHVGIVNVLLQHRKVNASKETYSPILVVGPGAMNLWLQEFKKVEPIEYVFIDMAWITGKNNPLSGWLNSHLSSQLLQAVPVIHCTDAYGVVFQRSEWKLVYSGDTRPCQALVGAGCNADVLIHEATFEDSEKFAQEAVEKNHSTTKEAIDVGRRMDARHIVLTHFSQRYPKVPVIDDGMMEGKVSIAFDLMTITNENITSLPSLNPILQQLFQSDEEEEE